MDILKQIEIFEEEMIGWRRELHRHPELSGQEENTCRMICRLLDEMGVAWTEVPDGGILGRIDGAKTGKTVLLRADVDALPIQEKLQNTRQPKTCVSEVPGICHACGHDAHTAMLLAAARVLQSRRQEMAGSIILMFERGEERTGNCIKIFRYIEKHGIHVDSCFGLHVNAGLDCGMLAVNDGPVMSSNLSFDVKIKGRSAHGSQPHLGASPIDCFVAFYNTLHTLRMRYISPFHPLTFSIGMLQSGHTNNIIPDELYFRASSRLFHKEDGKVFREALTETLNHVTAMYGCTYEYTLLRGPSIPVINDQDCAAMAREAIGSAIGQEHVCTCEPLMGSEPFGKAMAMWPGVFGLLGIRNQEMGITSDIHSADFDLDEHALKYGAAAHAAYALGFLASDIDTKESRYKGSFADLFAEQNSPQEMLDYLSGQRDDLDLG